MHSESCTCTTHLQAVSLLLLETLVHVLQLLLRLTLRQLLPCLHHLHEQLWVVQRLALFVALDALLLQLHRQDKTSALPLAAEGGLYSECQRGRITTYLARCKGLLRVVYAELTSAEYSDAWSCAACSSSASAGGIGRSGCHASACLLAEAPSDLWSSSISVRVQLVLQPAEGAVQSLHIHVKLPGLSADTTFQPLTP